MREIGGKMSRFSFGFPSSVFLRGFFLSISETLSCSCAGAEVRRGSPFCDGGVGDLAAVEAEAVSPANFFFWTLDLDSTAGLETAVVFRGPAGVAGLRVAVLLLVFVAIVVRPKFRSWLEHFKPKPCYCTSSCRCTAS